MAQVLHFSVNGLTQSYKWCCRWISLALEPQPLKGLMVLLRWMCSVQLKIMWSWWSKSSSYCWTLAPSFWSDTLWHLSSSMSEADSWHHWGKYLVILCLYLVVIWEGVIVPSSTYKGLIAGPFLTLRLSRSCLQIPNSPSGKLPKSSMFSRLYRNSSLNANQVGY